MIIMDTIVNVVDAIIILLILAGAVVGFKRGFTSQLISFIGIFVVVIFSFILKNPISIFLYEHFPFFPFGGVLKGVTVLNIALYEFIALFLVMSILFIILRVLIFATVIIEKILKFTIILGIPSKILGAILGVVESFVWIFIIMYIINLPVFNFSAVNTSKYKDTILNKTPILSAFADDSIKIMEEFIDLKSKYNSEPNATEFNKETLDLFLKYNVITISSVDKLIEKGKLKIDNVEYDVLQCYRETTKNNEYCQNRKGE